jgi:hypothetical protein
MPNQKQLIWKKMHLPKKEQVSTFTRTENNIRYTYDRAIAKKYDAWCAEQRRYQQPYDFTTFYDDLSENEKNQVSVLTKV